MAKSINLKFKGYYGQSNFDNIVGFLTAGIVRRMGLFHEIAKGESRLITHAGTAYMDNVMALASGEVDISIVSPITALLGFQGKGLFNTPNPLLRVIGLVPHDDYLVLAVDREKIDIDTMGDIARKKIQLRLSTQANDGSDTLGFIAEEVLKVHGFSSQDLLSWGGTVIHKYGYEACVQEALNGNVDAVLHEAIMTPEWKALTEKRNMKFIPMEESAILDTCSLHGLRKKVMPRGRLRGVDQDILTLDWGGWSIMTTCRLSDDLAYLLAQILIEDAAMLERKYTHLPYELSDLDYPITPEKVLSVLDWGIPLHSGAERYYREKRFYLTPDRKTDQK
jgi:TRAP-type uncharacterized transport system substrate-binding protein